MKNYMKIVSIFLILLFCLSPLAAMDTNQSSETANITHEIKNELKDPNLSINIDDIQEGDIAKIEVHADKSFSERLYVEIGNSLVSVKVNDGYGVSQIKDLPIGHYNAKITFKGNDEFKASECRTEFNVEKRILKDTNLTISVNDIYESESAVIELHADKDFTGAVICSVADKAFPILVQNGYGKTTIKDLKRGNYTVVAVFFSDGRYKDWNGSADFNVFGRDDLHMKVNIIEEFSFDFESFHPKIIGDYIEITIDTDEKFTGTVYVHVANKTQAVNVENGHGKAKMCIGALKGTFTAETTFSGNDLFNPCQVYTTFKMVQYDY